MKNGFGRLNESMDMGRTEWKQQGWGAREAGEWSARARVNTTTDAHSTQRERGAHVDSRETERRSAQDLTLKHRRHRVRHDPLRKYATRCALGSFSQQRLESAFCAIR